MFASRISQSFAVFLAMAALVRAEETMSYLDNGRVKVGVDLKLGGAITYLSRDGGENVINSFDYGRQVQLSFYSGPVPFSVGDKHPKPHWEHLGWNPIQAGDDFKHGSRVLEHRNDGHTLYVKCVPLQWPLDDVPGECTFESWVELDGITVKARARLNNARSDHTLYPARVQELPAVYANAPYHRVVSYMGAKPFTGDAVSPAPAPVGKHPWSHWYGTEQWAALLDDHDFGVGLVTPGRVWFTGGFAGKPGPNDVHSSATGYVASQALELLDHDIVYEYPYELVLGSLAEIRDRAAKVRSQSPPQWTFTANRQGWHYVNASDGGWPIRGALAVKLEQKDPQLISPYAFWQAEDAPYLIVEAAFATKQSSAQIFFFKLGSTTPSGPITFPITSDGEFHRYVVKLSGSPEYTGAMMQLRFDPVGFGAPGEGMKLRSVALSASP